jgi:hypothetical protein
MNAQVQAEAKRFLTREALSLRTRLDRLVPFSLTMTMPNAARVSDEALSSMELHMTASRRKMRRQIAQFIQWVHSPSGGSTPVDAIQRRFAILKMQYNALLSQFDIFADVLVQRSESGTGVWIAGLDDLATDSMKIQGYREKLPPLACYLDRGHGAAIRRAQARLPGGESNPVAIIRIPRERMVGQGIGSSLVHEVGHQVAAILDLVNPLRMELQAMQRTGNPAERIAWICWERWISEIVSDAWAVAKLGLCASLGLIGVVGLPRGFVFQVSLEDPHPFPWIRVMTSLAIGNALHPHPHWQRVAAIWESMYPIKRLPEETVGLIVALRATLPSLAQLILEHRPAALRGMSLGQSMRSDSRSPERIDQTWQAYATRTDRLYELPPSLAVAAIGQARFQGQIDPASESRLISKLLIEWAVQSALPPRTQTPLLAPMGPMGPMGPALEIPNTAVGRFSHA